MRVSGIAFGDGKSNQIRITCSQDVFSTPDAVVVSAPGTEWVDPSAPPVAVIDQMAAEIPYYELVQSKGQLDVDNNLAADPEMGYVMAAAPKPDGSINARLWTDIGSGYEDSASLDFCPYALTADAISPAQTSILLSSGLNLDQVEVGSFVQIGKENTNLEICRVDAIDLNTNVLTVGRGCLDTTPKPHDQGTPLFFWDLFNGYDPIDYSLAETVALKIAVVTGSGELSLLDATEMQVTLDQRAWRPYAPGQFQINAEYYPEDVSPFSGPLELTWVGRDRVQQTSGVVYDHTYANIGPEAGTTYRVQGYVNGSLVHTEEPAVSGTDWSPGEGIVRVEVHSKRDGVYSFQPAAHDFYCTLGELRILAESDDLRYTETGDTEIRVTED
jgi:hypothetical protein